MSAIFKIKNVSGVDGEWAGQTIVNGEVYLISKGELEVFRNDQEVMAAVAQGDLVVESATESFTNPIEGWNFLVGDIFPKSEIDGKKLAVHTSYKPNVSDSSVYAVWTGAGDDIINEKIGEGDLLEFDMVPGVATVSKSINFLSSCGRVWIHEGYLKFNNGGIGDCISACVVAPPTALQTTVNLDLILDVNDIKYSPSGAGTGTHGFAATPVLIPRTYTKDGDWDYDGTNLTPNMAGTGLYKIKNVKTNLHKYINRIPCKGTASNYFTMSSNETTELRQPYYLELICHNQSNSTWSASVLIEIYRQKTVGD